MKIPEPLFVIINPTLRCLLSSPLHCILSSSLLLIRFKGRRTGRVFTIPVRYVRDGEKIRCFTAKTHQWWRNLRGGAEVVLRIEGREARYVARPIVDEPERIRAALVDLLKVFPQDAPYHEIVLNADRTPDAGDLDRAARHTVMVEAERCRT